MFTEEVGILAELELTGVQSSYRHNRFGDVFYALTVALKPQTVVELGTFMGYSALHIAAALCDSDKNSTLTMIDLWDMYPYRHCSLETTREHFRRNGLLDLDNVACNFINKDAFRAHNDFEAHAIDMLHIDISNDGEKLARCMHGWHDKLKPGALVLIEGGSEERDSIEWMIEHEKEPIRKFLISEWFRRKFEFATLEPFPSLTIARKLS